MNLIERVKNILVTPKTEWEVINNETATPMSLLVSYVLPLALIPALATFLSSFLSRSIYLGTQYYVVLAIISYVSSIISFFIYTYALDLLAESFGSEKNINKSAQVAAYASTPSYIIGILAFVPFLGLIAGLAGFAYSAYLLYLGTGAVKKTPEDKKVVYVIVVILAVIVVYFIISAILSAIVLKSMIRTVTIY